MALRETNLDKLDGGSFDVLIVGGGINGAGIARDASGRGLSVYLAEKGKVGSATSSWSSKLIHGGLRYLENYNFKSNQIILFGSESKG